MATISFDIAKPFSDLLAGQWGDLSVAAKESLVIESYRTGKISIGLLAQILGLETRFQAEEWLAKRGVSWNYSAADFEQDCTTLDQLFPERN